MADRLMKDIADSTKDIASEEAVDITMTANFADRCTQLIKNLQKACPSFINELMCSQKKSELQTYK